jgi:hypothetical protein
MFLYSRRPRRQSSIRLQLERFEPRCVPALFVGGIDAAVNPNPREPLLGDFNGDGVLDLATSNHNSGSVTVLLGYGDGAFTDPIHYPVAVSTRSGSVGDLNGDELLDLVVLSGGSRNQYSVLLGNGDGTFQDAVHKEFGRSLAPNGTVLGDWNGDGYLDLAIANFIGDSVSVLLGNGDGTFQDPVEYPAGDGCSWITAADFNTDGMDDLAVPSAEGNNVTVLLNKGDGTFLNVLAFPTGLEATGVAAGDVNDDGFIDLAVTNAHDGTVSVLLGDGQGLFTEAVNYLLKFRPWRVQIADFNLDGLQDLAVSNAQGIVVLLGLGDGSFELEETYPVAQLSAGIGVGDFNNDWAPDVVSVGGVTAGLASILLNDSAGGLPGPRDDGQAVADLVAIEAALRKRQPVALPLDGIAATCQKR